MAPLAWRRRAPVEAAAVVAAVGLIQVAMLNSFLAADVAALVMIYALPPDRCPRKGRNGHFCLSGGLV